MRLRDAEAGISLIEVLVVLAIVGVMTGVTVLGLGAADRAARSEAEAMRLADRLQYAADEALVTSVHLALKWDKRSYRFVGWDRASRSWREEPQRDLGAEHELPAGLRLERDDGGEPFPVLITPDLPQPAVVLRVVGGGPEWRVIFDGLLAQAIPPEL